MRLKKFLLNFLITAGPTQEPIDPVRYISNYSSGKMGYALARAARKKGHRVFLISGPTALSKPKGVKTIDVVTAGEMYLAVMRNYRKADVIIKVAAVADYRPQNAAKEKIKKTKKNLNLKLVRTPDILKELGKKKRKDQVLVGFAAETGGGFKNAFKKLKEKNCDWIIFNQVGRKGAGFGSDFNKVTLLARNGIRFGLKKGRKTTLASKIIDIISCQSFAPPLPGPPPKWGREIKRN